MSKKSRRNFQPQPRPNGNAPVASQTMTVSRPLGEESKVRKVKLFIGVPQFGGLSYMEHNHGIQLLRLSLYASGIEHKWYPLANESLITRARNRITMEFLKSDCTDLLFIDADVGFLPKDVSMLMNSPFEIVCGAYPAKRIPWGAIHAAAIGGVPADKLEAATALYTTGLSVEANSTLKIDVMDHNGHRYVEAQDAATGFLLIRRHVIEKMVAHYRDQIKYVADYDPYKGETHFALFPDGQDPQALKEGTPARWLSEDYYFSRLAQMVGFKVHLCIDCNLSHTGTYTWRGSVAELFKVDGAPGGNVKPDEAEKSEAAAPLQ